jgi:YHS domain-containing protein
MKTTFFNTLIYLTLYGFLIYPLHAQQNLDEHQLAVSGYDVVEYFNQNAIPGKEMFQVEHEGAIYRFKNQLNKKKFEKSPEDYLPEYGGWCAYAMGLNGKKIEINPESFSIENKKLYLFYKTTFTDTKKKWLKKNEKLKTKANHNWNNLLNQ